MQPTSRARTRRAPRFPRARLPLAAVLALSAGLSGCQILRSSADQAPPARAPEFSAPELRPGLFMCWGGGLQDCYFAYSQAAPGTNNLSSYYAIKLDLRYSVLNTHQFTLDGQPVLESRQPDAAGSYFFHADTSSNVQDGRATTGLWVFPKRQPESPAHGTRSTLVATETSSNPAHRGTGSETASASLAFTYVAPGRCVPGAAEAPAEVEAGTAFNLTWPVTQCKRARLESLMAGESVPMRPGDPAAVPARGMVVTDQIAADFSVSARLTAPAVNACPSGGAAPAPVPARVMLTAEDALGQPVQRFLTIQVRPTQRNCPAPG